MILAISAYLVSVLSSNGMVAVSTKRKMNMAKTDKVINKERFFNLACLGI
jgi:hypothetical protein